MIPRLRHWFEGAGWSRTGLEHPFGSRLETRHQTARSVETEPLLARRPPPDELPDPNIAVVRPHASAVPRAFGLTPGAAGAGPAGPAERRAACEWLVARAFAGPFEPQPADRAPGAVPPSPAAQMRIAATQRDDAGRLAERLGTLFAADPALDGVVPEAALLVEALAHLAGPRDPSRALRALQALEALDPLAAFRAPPAAAGPSAGAGEDVWRLVADLATVPSGAALLQRLVRTPVPAPLERDFMLLFKAAAALPDADARAPTPAALRRIDGAGRSLARQAVVCAAARLAGTASVATEQHAWALNAVRNDLYDTAAGSPFAQIESRLKKVGVWIERVGGDHGLKPRQPFFGKSPFRALQRYGLEQVERGDDAAQRRSLGAATRTAVAALGNAYANALANPPAAAPRGEAAQVRLQLRRAALEHCLAQPGPMVLEGRRLGPGAIDDIVARLAAGVRAHGPAAIAQATVAATEQALRAWPEVQAWTQNPPRLSPERLARWAEQDLTPAGAAPYRAALAPVNDARHGRDTRRPAIDIESVRGALHEVVRDIQGSSRLRWTSGGVAGVGTKGLTGLISNIASALTVRARVDARVNGATQAVFEIAMPPYDMEILVGTQRQTSWQVGGGIAAGSDLGAVKMVAGPDVVLHGRDDADLRGVSLRLPRQRGREAPLRADFARLVDALLDRDPGADAAGRTLLKRLLQDFPELAVNRIGQAGEQRRRRGGGLEAVARAEFGPVRLSGGVGSGYEHASQQRTYRDDTGALRVHREVHGDASRLFVGATAALGAGGSVAKGFRGANSEASIAHPFATLAPQFDVNAQGRSCRAEYVLRDGGVDPASFIEVEHRTLANMRRSVEAELERWIDAKTARDLQTRAPPNLAPDAMAAWRAAQRDAVRDEVRDGFERFFAGLAHKASAAQSYAERLQLRPEAARQINQLESAALLAGRSAAPDAPARAQVFHAEAETLRRTTTAWVPASLRSYERLAHQDQWGLQAGLLITSIHTADGSHIRSRID
ncbi:MAG TPA: hypothetical protein VFR90_05035 [Methylibium sp.]|uniref:hypothetical protein n=1 Tax=Methylibium sp. TaxID=2067992 RepID=UPI002DBD13A2|nr:hypothetical protein [Methylibium sp.]HEU4458466.1 hypothetical protein [Methylibium sp.]